MLERDHPELSLKLQAELLGISYSSLFYQPVPPSPRELAIKRRIDEIYTAYPFYGSRKIAVLLQPEFGVSRPTVQAYTLAPGASAGVREMVISAVVPGPNTSKPAPEHQIYPYLLRGVTAEHLNHIWGIDTLALACRCKCHLHSPGTRLALLDGSAGLVFPVHSQLGSQPNA